MASGRGPVWVCAVCAMVCAGACSRAPESAGAPEKARSAMERTYRTGDPTDADLTVVVSLDRLEMTPADHVTLKIDAAARPGSMLVAPEIGEKLGDFTVAAISQEPSGGSGPASYRRITVSLEPFLSGKKKIPALRFEARGAERARAVEVVTDAIEIEVRSLLDADESATIGPAKLPIDVATRETHRSWVWAGVAGTCVALYGGLWAWAYAGGRKRRRLVLDAMGVARIEVDSLARILDGPPDTETDTGELCARLNTSLRRFAQRRFGVSVTSATLEQLKHGPWTRVDGLSVDGRQELCAILTDLDRLRFAPPPDSPPARPNVRALVDRSRGWLERVRAEQAAMGLNAGARGVAA